MALSRRFKEVCRALSLSTLLSSRRSMVQCPWLYARRWWLKLFNCPDLPKSRPLVSVAMAASLSTRSFPFTPVCPGQCTHRSFRRWVSTIATFQSERVMEVERARKNMSGTYYSTKYTRRCMERNITPKVRPRLPFISSNHTSHLIKQGHPQHTIKP